VAVSAGRRLEGPIADLERAFHEPGEPLSVPGGM
jgi:hypothetical protein